MVMNTAEVIVIGCAAYAIAGVVFALAFVTRGVGKVDPTTRGAGIGFRLVILPGAAALWPLMAARWAKAGRSGGDGHRRDAP